VSAPLRRRCVLIGLLALLGGCQQSVREDRTIAWSADGRAVGFQHGREGIFVLEPGGAPRKIFDPPADTVAASTPVWAPDGKRLLFTVTRPAPGQAPAPTPTSAEDDPAGNRIAQRAVVYTCYLRDGAGEGAANTALFEAACDHAGYVAANLAVRWHPRGDRVLFIDRADGSRHGLFEYDLARKSRRQVFPRAADALAFDWCPTGAYLAVAVGSYQPDQEPDGLWVRQEGEADWWHVGHAPEMPPGAPVLEGVRALLPAWAPDGGRFAFVSQAAAADQGVSYRLHLADAAARRARLLTEGPAPFRDLHWCPRGDQLGYVHGKHGALHVRANEGGADRVVRDKGVRRFAGWDHTGRLLAYTAPDPSLPPASPWTTLLLPAPAARDAVYVSEGLGPGRVVFCGLRVTFPRWSPREEKLSLWLTFEAPYQSIFSRLLRLGLRPGDPAAVLDLHGGAPAWMATSAHEKAQVGHYLLARRQYAEAWKWYAEAERQQPPPPPGAPADRDRLLEVFRSPLFFEYHCLTKQGRQDGAAAKLEQFRRLFTPPGAAGQPGGAAEPSLDLLRDLYAAEVFLSLDAAEDGREWFRRALREAATDEQRLSAALALSQVLLAAGRGEEYLDLAGDVALPALLRVWQLEDGSEFVWSLGTGQRPLPSFALLAFAPLATPDFLAAQPEGAVRRLAERFVAARPQAAHGGARLALDLVLRAAYLRLGQAEEARQADAQVRAASAGRRLPAPAVLQGLVASFRRGLDEWERMLEALRVR
jgi:Tol biopolymer transport system component